MAFFFYKDIKKNAHKKGVWLRIRYMLEDENFCKAVKSAGVNPYNIRWIQITEIEDGWARLECWSQTLWQSIKTRARLRKASKAKEARQTYAGDSYTVIAIVALENPEWVCESDLGRGLVK